MPKTFEILKYFSDFHQAVDRKKLLYHVVNVIATRIQEIENDMVGVMKSHWAETAESIDDLKKIAALYGVEWEEYEDVQQFRTKLKDIIRLYLAGPGTVPSIIEFSALVLLKFNVGVQRDEDRTIQIVHPVDGNEFRSQARIFFGGEEDYLEIHENTEIQKSYLNDKARHRDRWLLTNQGFFNYYPEIEFHGYDLRTINPILFNRSTGHALGFRGVIPEGSTLRIKTDENGYLNTAELDDEDVRNKLFSLKGAQFDRCNFEEEKSRLAVYKPERAFNEIGFAESLNGEDQAPAIEIPIPAVPLGESEWEFKIGKSEFNGSRFDDDAFTFPDEPSGIFDATNFNESVFAHTPSAEITMKWKEHQRAMFEVILPPKLGINQVVSSVPEEQKRQFIEPLQRVSKIVGRVKPAGVKAIVRYRDEGWILGNSILRDSLATGGIGVDYESTSI